jgi:hypothetical protein
LAIAAPRGQIFAESGLPSWNGVNGAGHAIPFAITNAPDLECERDAERKPTDFFLRRLSEDISSD